MLGLAVTPPWVVTQTLNGTKQGSSMGETPAEGTSLGASLAHTNNNDWWVEGRRCRPREDGALFA